MKVYTIYLNEDRGWTDNKVDGFYSELAIVIEEVNYKLKVPSEEEFIHNIKSLNIHESYEIQIGDTELKIVCEDMSEEDFKNLEEFSGW